ncbi:MAG: phosphatase PAP2 family protein [Bacteroidales bacterium]|nr:phosphatase PAP2 family protein [Bacteroidales bacterium]
MINLSDNKSLKLASQVLSVIFFPGFLPIYGLLLIFNAPTLFSYELAARYGSLKGIILLLAFVNMTVVPVAFMPLLKYRNIISSYSMNTRTDRVIPMAIGALMYIVTAVIFYSFRIPDLIKSFILASTVLAILILLITLKWKISIHSAGLGSLLAAIMALSVRMYTSLTGLWLVIILCSGLVMAARLYLNSHKPSQVYAGFALGFIVMWLIMVVF